jgi:hypothetical protein
VRELLVRSPVVRILPPENYSFCVYERTNTLVRYRLLSALTSPNVRYQRTYFNAWHVCDGRYIYSYSRIRSHGEKRSTVVHSASDVYFRSIGRERCTVLYYIIVTYCTQLPHHRRYTSQKLYSSIISVN